jgi:hypothetical protein
MIDLGVSIGLWLLKVFFALLVFGFLGSFAVNWTVNLCRFIGWIADKNRADDKRKQKYGS